MSVLSLSHHIYLTGMEHLRAATNTTALHIFAALINNDNPPIFFFLRKKKAWAPIYPPSLIWANLSHSIPIYLFLNFPYCFVLYIHLIVESTRGRSWEVIYRAGLMVLSLSLFWSKLCMASFVFYLSLECSKSYAPRMKKGRTWICCFFFLCVCLFLAV